MQTRASRLLLFALALVGVGAPTLSAQRRAEPIGSPDVRAGARTDTSLRIVIVISRRRLFVIASAADTLLSAPAAVGSQRSLAYVGQHWRFDTPRGVRTVLSKETDPVWIPPDWHYVEVARREHLRLVWLHGDTTIDLHDGSTLRMRGLRVRVEDDSTYDDFGGSEHVIVGNTLFVPPIGSSNRRVEGELGPYRLVLGDGLGIHGTRDSASIGAAATHGCVRLHDSDIAWLYEHIPVGTRVYIY